MFLMLYTLAYYVVRRRMSSLVAAGGFGIAVLISLRVAPIVSVVLGVVLGLLFLRRQRMASIAVLLGIFAVMTAVVFRGPLDELFSSKIQGSQDSARVALWRTSIQISKDRFPFGTGLGTFGGAVSQDYYSPVYYQYGLNTVYGLQPGITSEEQDFATDTHWPYVLGETGVIGLIMYVITLALIARSARRAVLTPANPLHLALALGAFLSFLAALVMAFVTPIFQATLGSYFTLGGAGVAYGAWRSHRALLEREQASLVPEPPERPALRVGAP
jgi:O-antigen ligase